MSTWGDMTGSVGGTGLTCCMRIRLNTANFFEKPRDNRLATGISQNTDKEKQVREKGTSRGKGGKIEEVTPEGWGEMDMLIVCCVVVDVDT